MLKLENVSKKYQNNKVLDNININFKTKELVFILGPSGSGKSTLLNIIGGLSKSDTGKILLDEEEINKYKNKKMDSYRRTDISYIFQEYNLIEYMSVWDNLTIIKNNYDKPKIEELLKQLSIYDKKNSKVSTLSGGEKQRVAIARAILKDSNIILCDEPTGALDTENSYKVIKLLKRISESKLVIVVSHNEKLAYEYANRIITIKDGKIDCKTNNDGEVFKKIKDYKITNKSLFKISIKNLLLNKKRTILTSLASSIGVFCLILVSTLSKGFKQEIDNLETSLVGLFPITIRNETYLKDIEKVDNSEEIIKIKNKEDYYHTNKIDNDYLEYLNKIKEIKYISYNYDILLPLVTDEYKYLDNNYFISIPDKEYVNANYEIIKGRNIENNHEILVVLDSSNSIMSDLSDSFNLEPNINYEDILNRRVKIILNDNYYFNKDNIYYQNESLEKMYENSSIELTVVGIVKEKEIVNDTSLILYSNNLIKEIIEINKNSQVVKNIINKNYILPSNYSKEEMLSYLGYNPLPKEINIYVDTLKSKNKVLSALDNYPKIIYEDNIQESISIVTDFTNVITAVLIIFSLISLLVASIMISILTNTRVIERTKEIGILRSLGASKRNIMKIFNTENTIISIFSILIALILLLIVKRPINNILNVYLGSNSILKIDYPVVAIIAIIDIIIVFLSGVIPAKKASNMDIAACIKQI